MRKIDEDIVQLCRVILGDVINKIKHITEKTDSPLITLTSHLAASLHEVGVKGDNKTLKELQSVYDAYNDDTLNEYTPEGG